MVLSIQPIDGTRDLGSACWNPRSGNPRRAPTPRVNTLHIDLHTCSTMTGSIFLPLLLGQAFHLVLCPFPFRPVPNPTYLRSSDGRGSPFFSVGRAWGRPQWDVTRVARVLPGPKAEPRQEETRGTYEGEAPPRPKPRHRGAAARCTRSREEKLVERKGGRKHVGRRGGRGEAGPWTRRCVVNEKKTKRT